MYWRIKNIKLLNHHLILPHFNDKNNININFQLK